MQQDFHYYATAVLARAAGFPEAEALTIAYAAQYVDDAQDGRDILVGNRQFSPLSTANDFGRYLDSKNQEVWLKVYLPFHFLPPGPIASDQDDFITQPLGKLSEPLLQSVARETDADPVFRLVRLGVALHTIADTWAHQAFSGRWNPENDVLELDSINQSDSLLDVMQEAWRDLTGHAIAAIPLRVAHFQAQFWPDYPFLAWRARFAAPGAGGRGHLRDNPREYLAAARYVHQVLGYWPKPNGGRVTAWTDLAPTLKPILALAKVDRQARCMAWQHSFGHLFPEHGGLPDYDRHAWEVAALDEPLKQTPFSDLAATLGNRPSYRGRADFADSLWVKFHRAAAAQRQWLAGQVSF